ncbi:dTDP-4-dehydrorhamnose reductase [Lysobacter sp. TY2-98]|uniref:dTDP-4-dehydrorhamnose reductase n=1 Tax=Lysobacter sp. TY2-98 TaxID=2290922 RepID=UPI000E207E2F|nr:dTDP-4-dehydrorhamnose reductase [Lysobacter sp. TY2-98]AXK71449.1 dTDP-4-dehydrorhamnose reductase [Lysobacter sp. TY2-98]
MKLLVIGATGQVGRELVETTHSLGSRVATTRSGMIDSDVECVSLDVRQLDEVRRVVRSVAPDVVINAAAYTAVDHAESNRDTAFHVNAEAVAAMADACRDIGARFAHYSTDYVFDGSSRVPYTETSPTCPLGVYGASKRAGEEAILASGVDHLILRTAWVYASHGSNFLRTMLRLGSERDELRVVADQIGSPTPARWIAEATVALLARPVVPSGIVNVVAAGETSWHGFATAIFEEASRLGVLQRTPRVIPIPSSDYPTPARRPVYSVLDTSRLRVLGIEPPPWREGLVRELSRLAAAAAG